MKKIFFNGTIVTLEAEGIQQAVLVEDGIIKKVGSNDEILAYKDNAEVVDLSGKTMLPAFIDAHSHLSSYASSFLQVPLDESRSFEDVTEKLIQFSKTNMLQPGQWIIAGGYDHNLLLEKAHPTRQLLDHYFPDIAVVLQHKSGHFGVFNSTALTAMNMKNQYTDGYLEENDFVEAIKKVPMPNPEQLLRAYREAIEHYASYGITTIQEGMMVSQMLPLYQMLLRSDYLTLDVIGYPQISEAGKFYEAFPNSIAGYDCHFKLGGYKIILDGSPQGRTAWMKSPYLGTTNDFGVSTMSDADVSAALQKAVNDKRQLLAHCNGDAAAEQFLSCAEKIIDKDTLAKIRPVMVHAQLLSLDQLEDVKRLGIIPSFFVAHCYYWGDTHVQNFGINRASQISPAKSALDQGILFTFHQDTPVIEPDMLQTIWCAVNRKTKAGVLLGENQQISVLDAIKAVTINAAYQYGEEAVKGSIVSGKNADFVILDKNPLEIAVENLNTISILETYKSGDSIYKK